MTLTPLNPALYPERERGCRQLRGILMPGHDPTHLQKLSSLIQSHTYTHQSQPSALPKQVASDSQKEQFPPWKAVATPFVVLLLSHLTAMSPPLLRRKLRLEGDSSLPILAELGRSRAWSQSISCSPTPHPPTPVG